jgi:hypothetical protein
MTIGELYYFKYAGSKYLFRFKKIKGEDNISVFSYMYEDKVFGASFNLIGLNDKYEEEIRLATDEEIRKYVQLETQHFGEPFIKIFTYEIY